MNDSLYIVIPFALLAVVGFFFFLRAVLSRSGTASVTSTQVLTLDMEEALCVCGDKATEPMPFIERERETESYAETIWMRHHDRNVYAAPPRLRRTVETTEGKKDSKPVLCRVHAHVADAKIDAFLYGRVRAVLAETNAQIAIEAAAFEKDTLLDALKASLTKTEKALANKLKPNGATNGTVISQSVPVQQGVLS